MRHHHEVALVVLAACVHAAPPRPPEPEVTSTVRRVPGGLAVAIDERPVRLGINGRTVTYRPARELDVLAFDIHDANACTNVLGGPVRPSAR